MTTASAGAPAIKIPAFVWNVVRHLAWLLRTPNSQPKSRLLGAYLKLCLKYLFAVRLLGRTFPTERLLGFTVTFYDYHALILLFEEIFVLESYRFAAASQTPLILDCGSNIGMAVLYFKTIYPGGRVIAFEPDRRSFEALSHNVKDNGLSGVEFFNCALFDREGVLDFYDDPVHPGDMGASAKRPGHGTHRTVQAVLLSNYVTEEVDFLKMDIEGSEDEVTMELTRQGKLGLIREGIIEYHHHIDPQKDRLAGFLGLLESHDFGYQISTFCRFEKYKEQLMLVYVYRKR